LKPFARKAIAGILAAIMLFAMLFTVGTAYFLFVNGSNQVYSQALSGRASAVQERLSENLLVNAFLANNNISFSVSNVGGVPVNITYVLITNSTGAVLGYYNVNAPGISPRLPLYINVGGGLGQVITNIRYSSATNYTIRLVTYRGSVFSATYPPTAQSLAAQALSSGAIGFIYLQFESFRWYNVTGTCPSACQLQGGLTAGKPAFAIDHNKMGSYIAFSINVTNLDPRQRPIVLDNFSYIVVFLSCIKGCGSQSTVYFYIVSYDQSGNLAPFTGIVLPYNRPVMLVFTSQAPGTLTPQPATGPNSFTSSLALPAALFSFAVLHGCIGLSQPPCRSTSPSYIQYGYGQTVPFLSTLVY
jgi:flagellin-like protein